MVNAAYGLTPANVALMWQTAPPRMPGGAKVATRAIASDPTKAVPTKRNESNTTGRG